MSNKLNIESGIKAFNAFPIPPIASSYFPPTCLCIATKLLLAKDNGFHSLVSIVLLLAFNKSCCIPNVSPSDVSKYLPLRTTSAISLPILPVIFQKPVAVLPSQNLLQQPYPVFC